MRTLGLLLATALLLPLASGHGIFEASELEIHLINDEGSDTIEPYGGYDIQDLFIGFAHDPNVGAGSAGDGFYLSVPLYGLAENAIVPPVGDWTVTFTVGTPNGDLVRTITSTGADDLTSDFDALLYEIDPETRTTLVQRAFVSYQSAGLQPGDALGPFRVESHVGGDLRDVAPGGIPVPGTDGAVEYPDPTAIEGQGELVAAVFAQAPNGYTTISATNVGYHQYQVEVDSVLMQGGQHVYTYVIDDAGWTLDFEGTTTQSLEPSGGLNFTILATPTEDGGIAVIEVQTDVGGRSVLLLGPEGLTMADGTIVGSGDAPNVETPSGSPVLLVALLAGAAILRRRV